MSLGTGCLLTFSKTPFLVRKIRLLLDRHGCLQELASRCSSPEHTYRRSNLLSGLCTSTVVEWLATFNQKRKIEQGKGERSCPLFSGNPPPHMYKKRERGRKNSRFTLAHEVAGLAR